MQAVHRLNGVAVVCHRMRSLPVVRYEFKCLKAVLWEFLLGLCHSKHATFNN